MAVEALRRRVRPGQRPDGIMVENIVRIARWVAGEASVAFIDVAADASMLIVRFRVGVAGRAGELPVVAGHVVAVRAGVPLALVRPTVNREMLCIVVESGGRPSAFRVAFRAVLRELELLVVWVGCGVVVRLVASETGVRRVVVVPVVASGALVGNRCVSTI